MDVGIQTVLLTILVEVISLDVVEVGLGQLCDFILVVPDAETCLQLPVLLVEDHAAGAEFHAVVLHCAVVHPDVRQTDDVADGLAGEEIRGIGSEELKREGQAIFEH